MCRLAKAPEDERLPKRFRGTQPMRPLDVHAKTLEQADRGQASTTTPMLGVSADSSAAGRVFARVCVRACVQCEGSSKMCNDKLRFV